MVSAIADEPARRNRAVDRSVMNWSSTVAGNVNSFSFARDSRARFDDRRAGMAQFSKSGVYDNVPQGNTVSG